jgi:hypothetical protein
VASTDWLEEIVGKDNLDIGVAKEAIIGIGNLIAGCALRKDAGMVTVSW